MRECPKPLAVFAGSDLYVSELIEACAAESFIIPEDVSILSLGNKELFTSSGEIHCSSIAGDIELLASKACHLLQGLMNGQKAPSKPVLIPPTGIVERMSSSTIASQEPAVGRAIKFMLDNYSQPLDMPTIAQAAGVSRARLYQLFDKDVGRAPGAVLLQIRLKKVKWMLLNTDAKVSQVAEDCGFGNRTNLYLNFKHATGKSPRTFRAQRW